jgi:hypothetical protein
MVAEFSKKVSRHACKETHHSTHAGLRTLQKFPHARGIVTSAQTPTQQASKPASQHALQRVVHPHTSRDRLPIMVQ